MKNPLLIIAFCCGLFVLNAQETSECFNQQQQASVTSYLVNDIAVSWWIGKFIVDHPNYLASKPVAADRALVESFQINLDEDLDNHRLTIKLQTSNEFSLQLSDLSGHIYYETYLIGDALQTVSTLELPAQTYFIDLISARSKQVISTFKIDIEP